MAIGCRHGGKFHTHDTPDQSRECWGSTGPIPTPEAPVQPAPVVEALCGAPSRMTRIGGSKCIRLSGHPHPRHKDQYGNEWNGMPIPSWKSTASIKPENAGLTPTQSQVDYAVKLGGDNKAIALMTRGQVSAYISTLKGTATPAAPVVPSPTVSAPGKVARCFASTASGSCLLDLSHPGEHRNGTGFTWSRWSSAYVPPPKAQLSPTAFKLAQRIRIGRFAWSPDSHTQMTFVRVTHRKGGQYKNCHIIQTQHGDNYIPRVVVYPSGNHDLLDLGTTMTQDSFEQVIFGVAADQNGCAKRWALEKNACWHCGKELTIDRSRWYGIGPECEQKDQCAGYVDDFDNEKGFTFDERHEHGF